MISPYLSISYISYTYISLFFLTHYLIKMIENSYSKPNSANFIPRPIATTRSRTAEYGNMCMRTSHKMTTSTSTTPTASKAELASVSNYGKYLEDKCWAAQRMMNQFKHEAGDLKREITRSKRTLEIDLETYSKSIIGDIETCTYRFAEQVDLQEKDKNRASQGLDTIHLQANELNELMADCMNRVNRLGSNVGYKNVNI